MKKNLIDKFVSLYCDGGWSISGTVFDQLDDKIFLKTKEEEIFIVFKEKVSMVKVQESAKPSFKKNREKKSEYIDSEYPENKLSYYESHMSLPMSLSKKDEDDNDFSVFFKKENSGLNFRTKGEDDK